MTKFILILTMIASMSFSVQGQSTKRKHLKPTPKAKTAPAELKLDTISDISIINNTIEISDFKKTVVSRVETVMITNLSDSDTIKAVTTDINYLTPGGKQLNRRTVTFVTDIPPMQTRHTSVPSWDKQQLFYHEATPPARKTQRTSPFKVAIIPEKIILSRTPKPSTPTNAKSETTTVANAAEPTTISTTPETNKATEQEINKATEQEINKLAEQETNTDTGPNSIISATNED